jgi:ribonuclease VapC
MVVDTSVFIAVTRREPDVDDLVRAAVSASRLVMSAGNYLECAMVAAGRGLSGRQVLDDWLVFMRIGIAPLDHQLAQLAADAFMRFGKGRHPAGLNYGDCFAYALAKSLGMPLLFKSQGFARTDITSALVR